MKLHLAYGREGLEVELPDDADITVIEPLFVPGLPDEVAALEEALRAPIAAQPLREIAGPEETVAVVFSDITRPTPNDRILPPLLSELARAGIPDAQITLINALGTHRPQTDKELVEMLGADIAHRYRIVQHDAWDDAALVEIGRNRSGNPVRVNRAYVEASVRVLTGFIEPHFFAGFSGGPKAVLPGIADIGAILDNHSASLIGDPHSTWAVTSACPQQGRRPALNKGEGGNPLWEEILEAAQATAPDFILNVTLNANHEITGVFAGDLVAAHRAGTDFVRETAMQPVSAPFDVVITSNSGYPLDLNLYQAVKGMSAAAQIVRPGGEIIVAAECWDGMPDHGEYARLLREADSPEALLATITAPGFRCQDQWEAQIQAQIQRKARVHVYADGLTDAELREAMVIPCNSIEETVARIRQEKPDATIAVLPEGPQTVPFLEA